MRLGLAGPLAHSAKDQALRGRRSRRRVRKSSPAWSPDSVAADERSCLTSAGCPESARTRRWRRRDRVRAVKLSACHCESIVRSSTNASRACLTTTLTRRPTSDSDGTPERGALRRRWLSVYFHRIEDRFPVEERDRRCEAPGGWRQRAPVPMPDRIGTVRTTPPTNCAICRTPTGTISMSAPSCCALRGSFTRDEAQTAS